MSIEGLWVGEKFELHALQRRFRGNGLGGVRGWLRCPPLVGSIKLIFGAVCLSSRDCSLARYGFHSRRGGRSVLDIMHDRSRMAVEEGRGTHYHVWR